MKKMTNDFVAEIAWIIREYSKNGDRALLRRRLHILTVNCGLTRRQYALIGDLKRRL